MSISINVTVYSQDCAGANVYFRQEIHGEKTLTIQMPEGSYMGTGSGDDLKHYVKCEITDEFLDDIISAVKALKQAAAE